MSHRHSVISVDSSNNLSLNDQNNVPPIKIETANQFKSKTDTNIKNSTSSTTTTTATTKTLFNDPYYVNSIKNKQYNTNNKNFNLNKTINSEFNYTNNNNNNTTNDIIKDSLIPQPPKILENESSIYRHSAQPIPPYVIKRLAYSNNNNNNNNNSNNNNNNSNTNNINSNKLEDVEKDAFTESFRDGYDQKSEYSNNDSSSLASSSSYNHNNNNNNNFNHNRNRNLKDEVNWNQFLKSLETNYALPKENFNYENSLYRTDTLNSSWHGHERLSTIFNIADENSKNTLWKRLFYRDLESSTNNDANTNPFTTSKKDNEKLIDNNNNNSDENINNNNNGNKKIKNNNVFSLSPEQIESYKKKASFFFSKEARKNWNSVLLDALISNSYIPLFFRIFIVFLSSVALGLASRIIVLSGRLDQDWHVSQQPSTVMAVVVDTVAIVYLFYIAYDEFTGQPIGLRNPHSKITLVLLDLFFIILSSANLSLSFNTLYDSRWVCVASNNSLIVLSMCERQRTLAAFLFLSLVMWVLTFTLSLIRIVKLVSEKPSKI
ncbi:hypothetical protein B5S29_g5477 [[Candida] boidinii]|nr:hypothetical protein B5S29_g5477 [[Candida] boidinii]